MTELEKCMESLIVIFHRYASENSDGKTLSKKELKKLIEEELPTFLKVRIFCLLSNLISTLAVYVWAVSIYVTYSSYFSSAPWTCLLLMLFQAQKNPKTVDCIMKDLDLNKDDKLDFEEFLPLVVGLSMACEKCYVLHEKKGKKWSTHINVDVFLCC